ncbi:hypothetical protein PC120_g25456 [Phytophthora cactorum]|nr:hypothetical protein PC120_g25456 [Phytophthora cactorum]
MANDVYIEGYEAQRATMVKGAGGVKYVLVLNDGMSGFVELSACAQVTSDNVYQGLMDLFKRFGVVRQWVSNQGDHFRNQVIERLQRALGVQHHFNMAYTPWANGTVEAVNRDILESLERAQAHCPGLTGHPARGPGGIE